jgi:hypothetical protein
VSPKSNDWYPSKRKEMHGEDAISGQWHRLSTAAGIKEEVLKQLFLQSLQKEPALVNT